MSTKNDVINPAHYQQQSMETIELIRGSMSTEAYRGFLLGNIIKYVTRYKYKNGSTDLRKAMWYLNELTSLQVIEEDANADN